MPKILTEVITWIVMGALLVAIYAIVLMIPIYFLWNWLMPALFRITRITLWQSLGISLLTGVLFRSSCYEKN